ncbi:tyrosine-type recombinase/integrase [Kitasatospora sp. NPDC059800]|uniref:tyrosine-type recombinase/integrase n=1 Tax=Kitasatospora sp. NPDC059800 TaxID=3346951 RepID=UPI00366016C8
MASIFQKCKDDPDNRFYPCEKVRCKHSWTVRFREPGGRSGSQRERSFPLKKQAENFALDVEHGKKAGVYADPELRRTPLIKVYEEYIESGDRISGTNYAMRTSLRLHIEPFFKARAIGTIKQKDLKAWLKWMAERGYAESTTVNRYDILAAVLNFALVNDYIPKNPCVGLKVGRNAAKRKSKKKIQIPTLYELQVLADHLPPQLRLLVWLMAGLGLRVAEAMAVSLGQFDFEAGVLNVDRQVTQDGENEKPRTRRQAAITKGRGRAHQIRHLKWRDEDESRSVPIPPIISQKVLEHVAEFGTYRVEEGPNRMAGDYLFSNLGQSNILMYSLVDRLWRKARKSAGVTRKITTHWLRHFFASAALSKGVPVNEVAEWLGHRDPKITYQTYAHIMPDAPQRLRTVMNGVFLQELELDLPLEYDTFIEAA